MTNENEEQHQEADADEEIADSPYLGPCDSCQSSPGKLVSLSFDPPKQVTDYCYEIGTGYRVVTCVDCWEANHEIAQAVAAANLADSAF